MSTVLWVLGAICAIVYVVSIVLGERLDGLGMVAFVLVMVAIITDRSLGTKST